MKKRRSDRNKPSRRDARVSEAKSLGELERLHERRTLFEPALARVVAAEVARVGMVGRGGFVVEIGSGGGQLRRWLPAPLLPAMVHTERKAAFARALRRAAPQAVVQVASAEALPYADASVAGVLGLCVLDVVDLEAVARELHRVLVPGGSVVQFWDMAPSMGWLCGDEIERGHVLLPNCFADPLVRLELPEELQTALPPLDLLRDLVSVPSVQLQNLIALLRPSPTNLIDGAALERLARYARLFDPPGTERLAAASAQAARALDLLGNDEDEARAYKRLLLKTSLILKQARGGDRLPLELREISSGQALAERLTRTFSALGMEVTCAVREARAVTRRPTSPTDDRVSQARFAGRWLGTTAYATGIPPAPPGSLVLDEAAGEDELVVEVGVLVLVAIRR